MSHVSCLGDYDCRYDKMQKSGKVVGATEIEARNISVCTPSGGSLFKNMSFHIPKGQHLLVMGPSGVGKTRYLVS